LTGRFRAWLGGSADAADRVLVAALLGSTGMANHLIRVDLLDYYGLLGEGSTPVRLPLPRIKLSN
jgi:hypothetical protein